MHFRTRKAVFIASHFQETSNLTHIWDIILLGWILERWDGVIWTGLIWLRIGTGGELL
jgi:hypothetical protein